MNLRQRHARAFVTLFSALVVALFSTSAAAIRFCELLDGFAPAHPQAKDVISFTEVSNRVIGDAVVSKVTIGPGNQIMIDVINVSPENVAMFPDYQVDTFNLGFETGTFGPLPSGQYVTTTSVRYYYTGVGFDEPCPEETDTFIVYADDGLSPVIEYYNSNLDQYFLTQNTTEIAALDAGVISGWIRTGQSFLAYRPGEGAGYGVSRWYGLPSAGLDTHFFTTSETEEIYFLEGNPSWEFETSDAFSIDVPITSDTCPTGELSVYRLWDQRADSRHRYTTDPAIRAQMIAMGYVAEGFGPDGIIGCAYTR